MRTLESKLLSLATVGFTAAWIGSAAWVGHAATGSDTTGAGSPTVTLASAGGSELPWWTPLAVCLGLLAVAGIYRLRHRPPGPGDDAEVPAGTDPLPPVPETHPADAADPPAPHLESGDFRWNPARS